MKLKKKQSMKVIKIFTILMVLVKQRVLPFLKKKWPLLKCLKKDMNGDVVITKLNEEIFRNCRLKDGPKY